MYLVKECPTENWGVIFNKSTGARKAVKVLSASWCHSQKLKIEIRKNLKHGFIAREKWMLVSSYSLFITLQIFEQINKKCVGLKA